MSKRSQKITILNAEQREAITQSPARLEVLDAVSDLGPCSVAEMAGELGRSPQSLYYHIEIMVRVGLLRQTGSRKAGKRDEALYDMVSEHFRLASNDENPKEAQRTLLRFNSTVLKLTERNHRDAVRCGLVRRVAKRENIYLRRQRGRLTDKDLERIYELLEEIGKLFASNSRSNSKRAHGADVHSYGFTVSLVPLDGEAESATSPKDGPSRQVKKNRKRST